MVAGGLVVRKAGLTHPRFLSRQISAKRLNFNGSNYGVTCLMHENLEVKSMDGPIWMLPHAWDRLTYHVERSLRLSSTRDQLLDRS